MVYFFLIQSPWNASLWWVRMDIFVYIFIWSLLSSRQSSVSPSLSPSPSMPPSPSYSRQIT